MAVQPRQTSWTDERLDDLNLTIRDGFARNDMEHQAFRQEMREFRAETNGRFDSLQRTMIIGFFGLTGTLIAALGAALLKLS